MGKRKIRIVCFMVNQKVETHFIHKHMLRFCWQTRAVVLITQTNFWFSMICNFFIFRFPIISYYGFWWKSFSNPANRSRAALVCYLQSERVLLTHLIQEIIRKPRGVEIRRRSIRKCPGVFQRHDYLSCHSATRTTIRVALWQVHPSLTYPSRIGEPHGRGRRGG